MTNCRHHKILQKFFVVTALLCFALSLAACSNVPKGREVKDEFMEDFFRPELAHESVKVIETEEGKRFVVVDFGRKLEKEELKQYRITLAKRGLNEYSTGKGTPFIFVEVQRKLRGESPYSSYEMLMFRSTVEEGVLEFSKNDINPPGAEIRSAIKFLSRFKTKVAIEVAPEFGRKWEKWEFTPEKEVPGVDPRIGKYPGSVRADVRINVSGDRKIHYYVQDTNERILDYYRKKLKRFVKLDPSLELIEGTRDGTTFRFNKLTIRPAKKELLFLSGHFSITVSIYQPYFSEELKVLEIHETITNNEDRIFVEKESRI